MDQISPTCPRKLRDAPVSESPLRNNSILPAARETLPESASLDARRWMQILAAYRKPSHARSMLEIAITFGAFVGLWALAWTTYYFGWWWLSLLLAIPAAGFSRPAVHDSARLRSWRILSSATSKRPD